MANVCVITGGGKRQEQKVKNEKEKKGEEKQT